MCLLLAEVIRLGPKRKGNGATRLERGMISSSALEVEGGSAETALVVVIMGGVGGQK